MHIFICRLVNDVIVLYVSLYVMLPVLLEPRFQYDLPYQGGRHRFQMLGQNLKGMERVLSYWCGLSSPRFALQYYSR